MVAHGRVKNGVVVLDQGVRLQEGQEVTVFASSSIRVSEPSQQPRPDSLLAIPPVSLGQMLRAPTGEDDLLEEMLEDRP
ncbi:MAG TPA: hypothetical protein VML55_14900 [Planctomycetaceae bacterium]|nr:hypothetical protein [Planctomycetaceae bacterium]